jgi:3D (Asp-Asp-Asp) domain-containing protein
MKIYAYPLILALIIAQATPASYRPIQVIATAYAPLDLQAVKNRDYQGDPRITASGTHFDPSISIAMSNKYPFGTWVIIPGYGWRRVDDRGKSIRGNRIDIGMPTIREALQFGRRKITIYVPKQKPDLSLYRRFQSNTPKSKSLSPD